jgi:hypothetical protein
VFIKEKVPVYFIKKVVHPMQLSTLGNAKGKSLKSEGIQVGMPRDKNKGIHGNCLIGPQLGHAEPKVGNPHSPEYTVSQLLKNSIFPHSTPLILQFSKRETHIHDISNTYYYLLFAKGKSLKSEGIGMTRDKNKGLHGLLGNAEPIITQVKPSQVPTGW